jgi:coproporphyrinogen III oxidase-like Fe-S oxidoreductase
LADAPASPADAAQRYLREGTLRLSALPPLALYVHLPWCLRKCPYCDFNSHEWASQSPASASDLPEGAYLDALRADLEAALPLVWGRKVHSVFIGGGTPSLFSPEAIDRLLGDVRARLPLEAACEITLEANPGTFERDRFRGYRQAGVTRLSVGVQSFDDDKLRRLGRVHDGAQAMAALEEARACFDTFNLDLMYAWMSSMPTWRRLWPSSRRTCPSITSRSSPTPTSPSSPRPCQTTTSPSRCWTGSPSARRLRGWRATKCRPTPGPAIAASTT